MLRWTMATRGEAFLILDDLDSAMDAYTLAIDAGSTVREIESMYRQAIWLAELRRSDLAVTKLDRVFRPKLRSAQAA